MTLLPLSLGPLVADGFVIRRSGIHWLCEDGHPCRPSEVIGYCNISLERVATQRSGSFPMADELEFQVAFAPQVAGRLQIAGGNSPGGYLNVFGLHVWNPDDILGYLDPISSAAPEDGAGDNPDRLRLLLLAGRRMTGLADVDYGLLPGWHSRSRAWWGDQRGPVSTLLCLGICDAAGIVRGNQVPFIEAFEASPGPAQLVYVPDHPVVPCAPILLEQLERTSAQKQAIASDLASGLASARTPATADDWLFAGALQSSLDRSPMLDTYDVLTPTGLRRLGPPDAILLSLSAEVQSVLRHKKLGYSLQMLRHRQASAGPAIRSWLTSAFEPIKRSIEDIRRDYRRLIEAIASKTGARIMILNRMSTSGYEDILSYAPFDAPMRETLENISAKEMNLMLHDLSEECDFSIVDVDAIAANLGGAEHLPDGIHHSGIMQTVLRSEIIQILNSLGLSPETSLAVK
jgi:hypothetical protein